MTRNGFEVVGAEQASNVVTVEVFIFVTNYTINVGHEMLLDVAAYGA